MSASISKTFTSGIPMSGYLAISQGFAFRGLMHRDGRKHINC